MSRIAVVQTPPVFLDRAATLAKAADAVAEAAKGGARVVVFPEAFVPGYPAWIWRLRPGGDMALTEKLHALLRANAVDLSRDDLAPLREAAKRHKVAVVCGVHERDADFGGGTLYNTVVVIGADGAILNRHRKLMPTNPERMVWGFGDASGLKTVDTPCGRVGVMICWESYMPLARYALYAQGIDVYVAPSYDSGGAGSRPCSTSRARPAAGSPGPAARCAPATSGLDAGQVRAVQEPRGVGESGTR